MKLIGVILSYGLLIGLLVIQPSIGIMILVVEAILAAHKFQLSIN